MNLIDTHFHLDLWDNPVEIAREIEERKIYTIAVTNAPSVYGYTLKLTENLKYIRPALGYHPEILNERPNDIQLFNKYVGTTKYIGEVGLDYACNIDKMLQRRVFSNILDKCADYEDKIITIHSRRAEGDIVDAIGTNYPGNIILHWYSGSITELNKALDNGYFFSVNYPMLRSKNGLKIIKNIPLDRVLVESDGPFTNLGSEDFSPLYINEIYAILAKLYKLPIQRMHHIVYNNFKNIVKNEVIELV